MNVDMNRPQEAATGHGHVAVLREQVQARLETLLPVGNERDLVALAMRESALVPGKRMRPVLLMMAGRGLGHRGAGLVDVACAVEMVHAASLVLDDMPCMDNAVLRRGRPTIHLHFGEDVAMLAAVGLLSRAFGVVAMAPGMGPAIRNQLVGVLSGAIGPQGLVTGQCQDLRDGARPRSPEEITATNELKTGVLFGAALEMAALAAGASMSVRHSLCAFAIDLGHAFQIRDDLLDADGMVTDKDTGKDDGKSTLCALLGEDAVRQRLHGHLCAAEGHLADVFGPGSAIDGLVQAMFRDVRHRRGEPLAA
jgi:geranylgeranyl diphosphate synthase type II